MSESIQGTWERCRTCLALFAHCDDVEMRMGGTFARMRREGRRVVYAVAVENAYFGPHLQRPSAREMLATRRAEARQGAAVLGASRVEFMGIKSFYLSREDGTAVYPSMRGIEDLREELEGVVFDGLPPILNGYTIPQVHDRIRNLILEEKPQLIITQSPDDRHPDHYCTARVVSLIVEDLRKEGMELDLWYSEPGSGGALAEFWPDTYVELSPEDVKRKGDALSCFPTQFDMDLREYCLQRAEAYGRVAGVPCAEAFRSGMWPRMGGRADACFARLMAGPPAPCIIPCSSGCIK